MEWEASLKIFAKPVNDSIGPDGLVPILFVYAALPLPGFSKQNQSPLIFQLSVALFQGDLQDCQAIRENLVNSSFLDTSYIDSALLGSHVVVYLPKRDKWTSFTEFREAFVTEDY